MPDEGVVILEADLVANDTGGMLSAFEAVSVRKLFLKCPDNASHNLVLLGAVQCDELLLDFFEGSEPADLCGL